MPLRRELFRYDTAQPLKFRADAEVSSDTALIRHVSYEGINGGRPVWSDDSKWLVFYAPFQRNGRWACNVTDARLESISFGRKSPPGPLVNVTDLFAD